MARRRVGGLAALLTALATVAACTGGGAGPVTTLPPQTTSAASSFTTTMAATTTTSAPPPSTTSTRTPPSSSTSTVAGRGAQIDAEVTVPEGEGPFPSVVLVHGGGWVTGNPGIMKPLADYLNESGFLTVNTRYALADFDHPGFPQAVEDVACAVSYAATLPDSNGTVALIGHSAGAHIGAVVALTGDSYQDECPFQGSGTPERFVGLAGPYDVTRLGLAVVPFFGGGPETSPEAWEAGNPQLLTDENVDLDSLIMYGENDGLIADSFAIDFHDALLESGSESLLELVEGARHNDLHDPDLVGDLIVTWLSRSGS